MPTPSRFLRWEYARNALARPAVVAIESGGLLLLVAIQHFGAGDLAKAVLAGASFYGLLAAPLVVALIVRWRWTAARGLGFLLIPAGLAFAGAGLSPGLGGFALGALASAILLTAASPLVTALWHQNVDALHRGGYFSRANLLAGCVGVASGLAVSAWLDGSASRYPPVMLALGGLLVGAGLAGLRLPGRPLSDTGRNPFALFALLWRDRHYGVLSLAWMLLGYGNLITLPLRTEYLAAPEHGLSYTASRVLLLTVVIPQALSLASVMLWGWGFDRVNFLLLRLANNLVFIASIALFFGTGLAGQVAGAALLGVAFGGGTIAWNLWVTKYAPAQRTADYMAVHTFLTGLRGVSAPIIAYALATRLALDAIAALGIGLLAASCLVIVWLFRVEGARPATI